MTAVLKPIIIETNRRGIPVKDKKYICSNCGRLHHHKSINYCFECGAKIDKEVKNGTRD